MEKTCLKFQEHSSTDVYLQSNPHLKFTKASRYTITENWVLSWCQICRHRWQSWHHNNSLFSWFPNRFLHQGQHEKGYPLHDSGCWMDITSGIRLRAYFAVLCSTMVPVLWLIPSGSTCFIHQYPLGLITWCWASRKFVIRGVILKRNTSQQGTIRTHIHRKSYLH